MCTCTCPLSLSLSLSTLFPQSVFYFYLPFFTSLFLHDRIFLFLSFFSVYLLQFPFSTSPPLSLSLDRIFSIFTFLFVSLLRFPIFTFLSIFLSFHDRIFLFLPFFLSIYCQFPFSTSLSLSIIFLLLPYFSCIALLGLAPIHSLAFSRVVASTHSAFFLLRCARSLRFFHGAAVFLRLAR